MTENQAENTTLETDMDWFLQALVVLTNKREIGVGVTLNVGGLMVSGELVRESGILKGLSKRWFLQMQIM